MATEEYMRSIEARLKLQDQLISHLFLLLYGDEPAAFAQFLKSQTAGLQQHQGPNDIRQPEEALEMRVAIKTHLDSWGNRTTATLQTAHAVRQARANGQD